MKLNDIINNASDYNENRKPFFNGNIDDEIIISYPRFKVVESNGTYSLRCFGDYYTKDGTDTNYSINVILTKKCLDTNQISNILRYNIQVINMLLKSICPNVIDENREYSGYKELLDDVCNELNKNVKGKNIRVNIRANELNGKYYYFLKSGVSIVPIERKTIKNEKSFPDVVININPNVNVKPILSGSNDESNNPYKNIVIRTPNHTTSANNIPSEQEAKPSEPSNASVQDIVQGDDDLPF